MRAFAHTLTNSGPADWEPLADHLSAVEGISGEFARWLCRKHGGAEIWGRLLGRWHDLGKYSDEFQAMLYDANGIEAHLEGQSSRIDHSTAAAQLAVELLPRIGRLLANVLAGHHAGLANGSDLTRRLHKEIPNWRAFADERFVQGEPLDLPPLDFSHRCTERAGFQVAFFLRMLFSCLIDSDRLETEAFCDASKRAKRGTGITMGQLRMRLDDHVDALAAKSADSPVNRVRKQVVADCRARAELAQGVFSLTVPTGGGKTLASLAFALKHAEQHNLRRVVMAIPFTSIIEQTAEVYRNMFDSFGDGVVIEHHSNLDPDKQSHKSHRATENWDAPLIVTTNVQLLESLFASRTSACRKLHRLSAATSMKVEDFYAEGKRWWLRLHEKGGKRHEVPAHHNADEYLDAYLKAAQIADEKKSPLFRTIDRSGRITERRLSRNDALHMVKRRAAAAGLSP